MKRGGYSSLYLKGASHDTEVGCISLFCAGAKKYNFLFLLGADPLNYKTKDSIKIFKTFRSTTSKVDKKNYSSEKYE